MEHRGLEFAAGVLGDLGRSNIHFHMWLWSKQNLFKVLGSRVLTVKKKKEKKNTVLEKRFSLSFWEHMES